jgi:transglutaminase-like putative cysteine protease/Flp pilus assembly protein TadD
MYVSQRNRGAASIIITSALLLIGSAVAGAQAPSPWNGAAFSLEPKEILKAASSVKTDKDDAAVYLVDEETYRFEADGTSLYRCRAAYKLLSESGVEEMKSVSCSYQPWRQDKPEIRARVIAPSGKIYILDQATLADRTSREVKDVYSDSRTLTAPIPGLEVGAVVEYEITLRDRAPQLSAGAVYRRGFGFYVPISYRSVTVDCDVSIPLRYAKRGPGSDTISVGDSTSGDRRVVTFTARGLKAIREIEEYIPRDEVAVACVEFSTAASWRAVADAYSAVVEPFLSDASAERFALQALGDTPKTERNAVISAIMDKIGRDIRYTGINFAENAIVPHAPSDTIARGYGDCKDQAVLLAASLRSLGIEARLALLNADIDSDVLEELPGFGLFNHAIVYLPEDKIWIDPTANYFRPGDLPPSDLGRKALVIAPGTTGLTRTLDTQVNPSRYHERRTFLLADSGPAAVVETTTVSGVIEADYRSSYASGDPRSIREHLEKYVKDIYKAESLESYTTSAFRDLRTPFTLEIKASKARRGYTDDTSSIAILQSGSLFNFLPRFLTEEAGGNEPPRTMDVELPYLYTAELEFNLIPPPGFKAASLPESGSRRLGPAKLDTSFALGTDGTVTALLRFDPVKARYSPAEVKSLRDAILEYYDEDAPRVTFEQIGESLLAAGKYHEALKEFHSLASLHPKKAIHRIQISRALEAAGFGGEARKEARAAVSLEPTSASAHARLAWTYILGPFARPFEDGCDLDRAAQEYAAAAKLDPSNLTYVMNQAILAEYGEGDIRYGTGSELEKAFSIYEKHKKELKGSDWENNPLVLLMRMGRFKELKDATKTSPANKQQKALYLCSAAALDGSAAALREASRVCPAADERRDVLSMAASMLLMSRRYPEAAELMAAGARGGKSQTELLSLAEQIAKLKPIEVPASPGSDAGLFLASFAKAALESRSSAETILQFYAKSRRASLESQESLRSFSSSLASVAKSISGDDDIPAAVVADIIAGLGAATTLESGPAIAVLHSFPAFPSLNSVAYYMTIEDGALRIVDMGTRLVNIGREILDLLDAGDLEAAREWFSLLRYQSNRNSRFPSLSKTLLVKAGGDPSTADENRMRFAASLALAQSSSVGDCLRALPFLLKSIDSIGDKELQTSAVQIAASCLLKTGAGKEASKLAERLEKLAPNDEYSNSLRVRCLDAAGESAKADALISAGLAADPNSASWLRISAEHQADNGRYAEAVRCYLDIINRNASRDGDFNQAAWYSLFSEEADFDGLESKRAVQRLMDGSSAEVHTIACVLAESGRFVEAQEAFRKYLSFEDTDPRSSATWLVFGLYAESFGLKETAVDAYRKTKNDENRAVKATSRELARLRLRKLGVQ